MKRRSLVVLLALAAFGCKESMPSATQTGLRLTVEYESTLGVDTFSVLIVDEAGTPMEEPIGVPAPIFLEPPGLRVAAVVVETPGVEGAVGLRVDGLADERVVGSGWAEATIEPAKLADATVRLGAPNACGDGRVHATLERCDDGNVEVGDGCSDLCLPESGFVCTGAPSICVECGNGVVEQGETCDDGNRTNGDGCNTACELEPNDTIHVYEQSCVDPFRSEQDGFVGVTDCILAFTPGAPDESWLVFVSGSVGSDLDAELAAEVRVLHGDIERDHFGHQTLQTADRVAGFMTFFVVRGEDEQRVTIELDAKGAPAMVRDVRLVAARVPADADLHEVDVSEMVERTGERMTLASLEMSTSEEGEYVFLAKANASEGPGDDTVRTWVIGPDGEARPNINGVGWTNGRSPNAPMFMAFTSPVLGDAKVSIEGTSSGAGEVDGWWNRSYRYRRPVQADWVDVPAGAPTQLVFSHAAMVQAGRSQPDGDDVRLIATLGQRQIELPRVLDPQSSWDADATHLWFGYRQLLAEGAVVHLYFGNADAGSPGNQPSDVFTYYDGGNSLDGWVEENGMANDEGNGRIRVPSQTRVRSTQSFDLTAAPLLFEARLRFIDPPQTGNALYWGIAGAEQLGSPAGFAVADGVHAIVDGLNQRQTWEPAAVDQFQRYLLAYGGAGTSYYAQNEDYVGELTSPVQLAQTAYLNVENQTNQDILIDWVRVYPATEPRFATLAAVEGHTGLSPSTWSNLRIVAFRTDAFERVQSAANPELSTTTSTFTQVVTEIETEAPGRRAEYLVLQSARIGGDSSETAGKSGVLLADGDTILRTDHVINRSDDADGGYHHVAGAAYRRETDAPMRLANGVASPDGARVSIAASNILVLRYAPR